MIHNFDNFSQHPQCRAVRYLWPNCLYLRKIFVFSKDCGFPICVRRNSHEGILILPHVCLFYLLLALYNQRILLVEVLYYCRIAHGSGGFHTARGICDHSVCVIPLVHRYIPTMTNRPQYMPHSSHYLYSVEPRRPPRHCVYLILYITRNFVCKHNGGLGVGDTV